MDAQKVDLFMSANNENFPQEKLSLIREALLKVDDGRWTAISSLQFKKPMTAFLVSLFLGVLGGDRFYLGETGLGVAKLLTCGGAGIWAIVDLFLIMGKAREWNYAKILPFVG